MIEMLNTAPEKEKSPFEQYFEENIIPLVEEENRLKSKYKSSFWTTLWIVLFLNSANMLIVLYGALQKGNKISFEQMFLVALVSLLVVYLPIKKYKKISHTNIFAEFLKFYPNFTYSDDKKYVQNSGSDVIPSSPFYLLANSCKAVIGGVNVAIRDIRTGSKNNFKVPTNYGTFFRLEFETSPNTEIELSDKSGLFGNSKHAYLSRIKRDSIPASKYFDIYADSEEKAKNVLGASFFENLLDLKEIFGAKKIKLHIKGNKLDIFCEKSYLYFETLSFFGQKTDKNKFLNLHKQFEQLTIFANTMQSFMEQ